MKPVAVDLFCGIGGLTYGMRQAGIEVVAGFDLDKNAKELYEKNNPGSRCYTTDVKELTGDFITSLFGKHDGPKILAGCAPCTPFSAISREKGMKHKDYGLLNHFARLVREVKPDGVIMENVPGLIKDEFRLFDNFLKSLRGIGLKYDYQRLLDAADYGVPQHRRRLILIASATETTLPSPTHGPKGRFPHVTVKESIGRLPRIESGHRDLTSFNHSCKSLTPINIKRLDLTPHDGGSRKDIPPIYWISSHKKHSGHGDTYGRMKWDSPSPTLTGRCLTISNGRFSHPEQNRPISIREAAILQSFPINYEFPSGLQRAQKYIGNAVPPLLAEKISIPLISSLTSEKTQKRPNSNKG